MPLFILGTIKSYTSHTYRVDGVAQRFTVDQTITFKECPSRPDDGTYMLKLNVIRNFLVYGDREEIVRFAMTNRIATTSGTLFLLWPSH